MLAPNIYHNILNSKCFPDRDNQKYQHNHRQIISLLNIFRRVRKISKRDYWLRHVCLSVRPSTWNTSTSTRRIFMNSVQLRIFVIPILKIQFSRTLVTSHESLHTIMKISRSFLLIMSNVSDNSCTENQNTYSILNNVSRIVV